MVIIILGYSAIFAVCYHSKCWRRYKMTKCLRQNLSYFQINQRMMGFFQWEISLNEIYKGQYLLYLFNLTATTKVVSSLCDKVCQWLATCWWFSSGTPVSSTIKKNRHDITAILLKVALNTINQPTKPLIWQVIFLKL